MADFETTNFFADRSVHDDPGAREEMPCLPERFQGRDYLRGGEPPESAAL